jgi:DNA invertase Pin-like site-specific DNA recombinase
MSKQFVIYLRVSTAEQQRSGLGIEAQVRDIDLYLATQEAEVLGRFTDTGSGADDDRPELLKALKLVRKTGAELLISKLDRLSRDVAMIATLMKDKDVNLRVASMPSAEKFSLHIYAALAEQEREMISMRTKAALQSAKARGVKLGGYREGALPSANAVRETMATLYASKVIELIAPMRESGLSLRQIADKLNQSGIKTSNGKAFEAMSVSRIIKRMEGEK